MMSSSSALNTLPVGLCGRVEQQQSGAGAKRGGELVGIEAVAGRAQLHQPAPSTGHRDVGRVDVEVRLERHHLVAGAGQGQDRGGDRLSGARGDQHLGVGIEVHAPEPLLVLGDGLAQHRVADTRRVLVEGAPDGLDGGLGHLGRPVGVGEALAQVDGAGADRQRGHLGEYRCSAEGLEPLTKERLGVGGHGVSLGWALGHAEAP